MNNLVGTPSPASRILLIVATPVEARAILAATGVPLTAADEQWRLHPISSRLDLVVCGIGKANAAAATVRFVNETNQTWVVSIGLAGALPGSGLSVGMVVVPTASVYADEGLQTEDGFRDCASMGFPLGPFAGAAVPAHEGLSSTLMNATRQAGHEPRRVRVATVSTCSGTDALAAAVASRAAAGAEAMEGAAVLHAASRIGIAAAELRVISNTTGDRRNQIWDLHGALSVLGDVACRL